MNTMPLKSISLLVPFRMVILILRIHCLKMMQVAEANVIVNIWIIFWYPEHQAQAPGIPLLWCSRGASKSNRSILQDELRTLSFPADWAFSVCDKTKWEMPFGTRELEQNGGITSPCDSGIECQIYLSWAHYPGKHLYTYTHLTGDANTQEREIKVKFVKR